MSLTICQSLEVPLCCIGDCLVITNDRYAILVRCILQEVYKLEFEGHAVTTAEDGSYWNCVVAGVGRFRVAAAAAHLVQGNSVCGVDGAMRIDDPC